MKVTIMRFILLSAMLLVLLKFTMKMKICENAALRMTMIFQHDY